MKQNTLLAIAAGLGLVLLWRNNALAGVGLPASAGYAAPGTFRSTTSSPSLVPAGMRSTTPQGYAVQAAQAPSFKQAVQANLLGTIVNRVFNNSQTVGEPQASVFSPPIDFSVPSVPHAADIFQGDAYGGDYTPSESWTPGSQFVPVDPYEFSMEGNW